MEIRDFYTPPGEKKKVSPPKDFWLYAILGWAGCFVAAVFLFSKMFGSFVEPESSSAYAFYGFLSLVPGVIIGLLVYNAKKSAYEQYLRECQQENNNTIHPSTDSIQPINSAESTKTCPYCGETILAVAKKCKHCGEWLDRGAKPNVVESTPPKSENATIEKDAIRTDSASSGTTNKTEAKKSRTLYYIIGGIAIAVVIIIAIVSGSSSETPASNDDMFSEDMVVVEETPIDTYVESGNSRAKEKFDDALREISGVADNAVKYSDGRYIWYNPTTPWGYSTILSVYDSQTGNTTDININKTSSSEDMMTVKDISEHNGKITVVLEENRNSNGWVEGTYVWTIDCSNRNWKCVANGVAGAEIINGGSAVKITTAKILNPDAPTFEQQYKESTKTISL